jgi:hypothetical protein
MIAAAVVATAAAAAAAAAAVTPNFTLVCVFSTLAPRKTQEKKEKKV